MRNRKLLALLLAVTLLAGILSGCANGSKTISTQPPETASAPAQTTAAAAEPTPSSQQDAVAGSTVTAMFIGMDDPSIALLKLLEKPTGLKLDILTGSWDQYAQKVNTMMATGEKCDLITCEDSLPWRSWAVDGLIKALDDIPGDYPYIKSITEAKLYASLKEGGKRYVIPNAHHGSDWGFAVRGDIMEKYGITEFKTIDDYYATMVRAHKDYGVYGFTMPLSDGLMKLENAQQIFAYYGGGGIKPDARSFVINNGVVTDLSIADGTKQALQFLNKLYRDGLMNKDYATIGGGYQSTYMDTGKTFSLFNPSGAVSDSSGKIKTLNPDYKYIMLPPMGIDRPEFNQTSQSFSFDMWQISFVPSTAQNPLGALKLFEFGSSREGRELLVGGEKGVTTTDAGFSDDGVFTTIPDNCTKLWNSQVSPRWWGAFQTVYGYIPVEKYSTFEEAYAHRVIFESTQDEAAKNLFSTRNIVNLCGPYGGSNELVLVSLPIETEVRPNLNNIKGEYWNKMITASDDATFNSLWDQYIPAWKSGGGDKYVAAYQEYYDKLPK